MAKKKPTATPTPTLKQMQTFAKMHAVFADKNTPKNVRDATENLMKDWLKRYGMQWTDIPTILAMVAPPPPPSDPRDAAPNPFTDPTINPAGVIEAALMQYVTAPEHLRTIFVLWCIFTHIYKRFAIAPRIALVSDYEDSGKSTMIEIAKRLVLRPNADSVSTGAAIIEHIDEAPGTVCADELDLWPNDALGWLLLIYNLGHLYSAKRSLMVKGERKEVNLHAPVIVAGVGDILLRTQKSRSYTLEMQQYTLETKPPRDFFADLFSQEPDAKEAIENLNDAYKYVRAWIKDTKINTTPVLPAEVITRYSGNALGLVAVADACSPEWGRRARAAMLYYMGKAKAEHPKITFIRHGLVIFEALGVDRIRSTDFNRELKLLDLPDARWTRYRSASGIDRPHSLTLGEQAALAAMVGIYSDRARRPGEKRFRGYTLAQFEEAARKYDVTPPDEADVARSRLRLIAPSAS